MLSAGSTASSSPFLSQLLQQLSPAQRKFFTLLDIDLGRVESFFLEREKEAEERHDKLREQLDELVAHRQRIYVSTVFGTRAAWWDDHCNRPSFHLAVLVY
ncbi:hypothetical protein EDC04DRAFT_1752300 [Pisolithus marmoratus]|nr:hypothetical protein EDC04DRAFT_1752300 [Pisolithus marmoratus]